MFRGSTIYSPVCRFGLQLSLYWSGVSHLVSRLIHRALESFVFPILYFFIANITEMTNTSVEGGKSTVEGTGGEVSENNWMKYSWVTYFFFLGGGGGWVIFERRPK